MPTALAAPLLLARQLSVRLGETVAMPTADGTSFELSPPGEPFEPNRLLIEVAVFQHLSRGAGAAPDRGT